MSNYQFSQAVGGMFVVDEQHAAARLPAGLLPLPMRPGAAIVALTAFDFHESEVGPYRELVLSIMVPPHAERGEPWPTAAMFPFLLATSTEVSRVHAVERWRLPDLGRSLDIQLERERDIRRVRASEGDELLLELSVRVDVRDQHTMLYQFFANDAQGLWRADVRFEGRYGEHEDESGQLRLGTHTLARELAQLLDDPTPFREHAMEAGVERFGELLPQRRARRSP